MRSSLRIAAVFAVLGMGVSCCLADSLEDVEKKIVAAFGKVKSFQAKMLTVQDMTMGDVVNKSRIDGTYEFVRKDNKGLYRMEAKTSGSVEMKGGQSQKMDGNSLVVNDGEYAYTYSEAMGQKTAMKLKADPRASILGDESFMQNLKKDHDVKLLPDEKLDGKSVWVIEATPKKPGMIGKFMYYFDQECGIALKTVGKSPEGKDFTVTTLSDVKLNADLSAERFVFKAPEGVTVQDMTKVSAAEAP